MMFGYGGDNFRSMRPGFGSGPQQAMRPMQPNPSMGQSMGMGFGGQQISFQKDPRMGGMMPFGGGQSPNQMNPMQMPPGGMGGGGMGIPKPDPRMAIRMYGMMPMNPLQMSPGGMNGGQPIPPQVPGGGGMPIPKPDPRIDIPSSPQTMGFDAGMGFRGGPAPFPQSPNMMHDPMPGMRDAGQPQSIGQPGQGMQPQQPQMASSFGDVNSGLLSPADLMRQKSRNMFAGG